MFLNKKYRRAPGVINEILLVERVGATGGLVERLGDVAQLRARNDRPFARVQLHAL